ncbi:fungal-specific transcription factor domain-containing protein [Aspergillus germanicus]
MLTSYCDRRGLESSTYHLSTVSSPPNGNSAVQSTSLEGRSFPAGSERLVALENLSVRSGQSLTAPSADESGGGTETPYHPFNEHFGHHNDGDASTLQPDGDVANRCYSPLYGDPRGVGLVVDICEPESMEKSGHFLVPRISPGRIDQETIGYLRHKGAFNFPTSSVCELIVRKYFHYVHPFFPVVDACSFLDMFENARNEVSVHLLWSMFLAAANFADDSILQAMNFSSRKEMKRAMYTRAKALYDTEYEKKKITLIQAVLLTGFWYSDTEDRTGPWHWNGVAIGLCQTIGLHRQPDTSRNNRKSISMSDSRIWKQLWWSCVYREVWFSAGMGRPMRINLDDCSTPMPDAEDSDNLAEISESTRKKYLPEGTKDLSKLWTELLALSVTLAKILFWQNRAERTRPSRTEIQHTDERIRQYFLHKDHAIAHRHSYIVSLHEYHLELYIQSVVLILYRPFLFDKPETYSPDLSVDEWTSSVLRRTKDAATNTNKILGDMIGADMISNIQAIVYVLRQRADTIRSSKVGVLMQAIASCIALVPALQIHLIDTTSKKPLVQRMGCHNLDFCMLVIEELRPVYFGAELLARMFTKAKSRIKNKSFAPATALNDHVPQSNRDSMIHSIPDALADDACQNDAEIFDTFSTILSPFAPAIAGEYFFNDELLAFDSDITLGQLMFPETQSSADTL